MVVFAARIAAFSGGAMTDWSRRELLSIVAAGLAASELPGIALPAAAAKDTPPALAIRTITGGVQLSGVTDQAAIERVLARLHKIRDQARQAGYTVQTIRVATNPIIAPLDAQQRKSALAALEKLDAAVAAQDALLSIGPVLTSDTFEPALADWAAELVKRTHVTNFSISVTAPPIPNAPRSSERAQVSGGVNRAAIRSAANVIARLAHVEASGSANFRFAAAAGVAAGTPFFPVAYHDGTDSLAVGLESADVVRSVFASVKSFEDAEQHLRGTLVEQLGPIEHLMLQAAAADNTRYLGIDPCPAPSITHSIAGAIEALTGKPFGHPSTLQACAAITGAVKTLSIRTCGYAGLMLPVLEDTVLAKRAAEHRYGIQELLLYSTVCGTGLDSVPVPGDASIETLERVIADVATLTTRLRKPLSVRLFPVPGKKAGELASFKNSWLTECQIFALG
jgi:uncharacterized protein